MVITGLVGSESENRLTSIGTGKLNKHSTQRKLLQVIGGAQRAGWTDPHGFNVTGL
jgi:hypothetical protein